MTLEAGTGDRHAAVATLVAGLRVEDAVLAALVYEQRYPSEAEPVPLEGLFPGVPRAALADLEARAAALMRTAPGYAVRLLTRAATAPQLIAEMADAHPGFSHKSYADVLFLGVQAVG